MEKNKYLSWFWIAIIVGIVSIIAFSHLAFSLGEFWGYVQGFQDGHNTYLLNNITCIK